MHVREGIKVRGFILGLKNKNKNPFRIFSKGKSALILQDQHISIP
jgi:hypothetical protein